MKQFNFTRIECIPNDTTDLYCYLTTQIILMKFKNSIK